MSKIIQQNNPILRKNTKEVPVEKITSPEIQKILKDMKEALDREKDGVAIAASQIGKSLRIFVVSGKLFDVEGSDESEASPSSDLVFINPTITKLSKDNVQQEEGCLSVRGKHGIVKRANKTTVRAYDEHGKTFERGGSGLLAQIFQHEMDHLSGVLFTDKADSVSDVDK